MCFFDVMFIWHLTQKSSVVVAPIQLFSFQISIFSFLSATPVIEALIEINFKKLNGK